jgi:hypothetical protein
MQTVASLRSRRTESRKIADDVVSTTRTLSGLSTCVVAFKPIRQLLVGGDGIALEAFLQAPLTEARTPLRCHQCRWFPFWSFSTENWFYGHTGACRLPSTLRTSRCAMEVTVRDHWRRRSRIPARRPNGLRRSVGARAGRTRCGRSGHRRSGPGLHASPATHPAAVLGGFPQPAYLRVRRQGSVLPVGSPLPVPAVDARLRASRREQAPAVDARLRASRREQAPGGDARLRASVPRG